MCIRDRSYWRQESMQPTFDNVANLYFYWVLQGLVSGCKHGVDHSAAFLVHRVIFAKFCLVCRLIAVLPSTFKSWNSVKIRVSDSDACYWTSEEYFAASVFFLSSKCACQQLDQYMWTKKCIGFNAIVHIHLVTRKRPKCDNISRVLLRFSFTWSFALDLDFQKPQFRQDKSLRLW